MKTLSLRCAALVVLFQTGPAMADSLLVPITPGLPGWEEVTFRDKTPNLWRWDEGALAVESNIGASMLYQQVAVDLTQTPILRWRWRVDTAPPPTDLSRKGGDDRALSLTIGYEYEPKKAGLGERMKRMVVEAAAGSDAPGRVIELAWGGNGTVGVMMPDPYSAESGGRISLRLADHPTGVWEEESVDVAALYRERFGGTPPRVVNLALISDGDDTGTNVRARIADLRFEMR